MMYTDVATALDCTDDGGLNPVYWDTWIKLPVRERDHAIHSTKITFRAPTVIIAESYAKVPKVKPVLTNRAVAERDAFICQYTNEYAPDGNVDHVVPKGRGGQNTWDNVVWCKKSVNSMKGKKLNEEIGLKLVRKPREPLLVPKTVKLKAREDRPEWKPFLIEKS